MSLSSLSQRVRRVALSPNAAAKARAQSLAAQGRDIIELTSGEPDFDTPDFIKEAAVAALWNGATKYTATNGTAGLRQAISDKFARDNDLDFPAARIIVSNGGKQIIYNALAATLDAGDQVIIPAPYWQSFPAIVKITDGIPVVVQCARSSGYKLTPAQLEAALTPRTRWLVLNTPSNPSGAVYTRAELGALAEVLRRYPRVWVLLDEIYERIRFDDEPRTHFLHLAPDLRSRTLIVNGASKTYAMTGWRIGYGAGPAELIDAMTVVQSQVSSAPSAVGQAALAAALVGDQSFIDRSVAAYRSRRDLLVQAFAPIDGLTLSEPQGAFFAFTDCSALLGRRTPAGRVIDTDLAFVDYLLTEHGVAAVDGTSFGSPGHFRLSIAAGTDSIAQAAQRIAHACASLSQ